MSEPLRLTRLDVDGTSVAVFKPGVFVVTEPSAIGVEGEREMGVIVRRAGGMVWVVSVYTKANASPRVNKVPEVDALHHVRTGMWRLGEASDV